MRKLSLTLWCSGLMLPLMVACGDSTSGQDAAADLSAANHDLTTAGDLTTGGPDAGADGATPADMTGPAEDMTTFSATIALSAVKTTVPIPVGDGGINGVQAYALIPTVSVGGGMPGMPDRAVQGAGLLSCSAAHYSAGHLPGTSGDAGKITLSGYTGGALLAGGMAASEIDCILSGGKYGCTYGTPGDGGAGTDPSVAPYAPGVDPLGSGMINFKLAGGAQIGPVTTSTAAAEPITVTEDLTKQKYTPTSDVTFHYTCASGTCGVTAIAVNVSAHQTDPRLGGKDTSFGGLTCAGLATSGSITVTKDAIAAMLGCDTTGANCDSSLKYVQTAVVHFGLPKTVMDPNGDKVNVVAGHGVAEISPQ